MDASGSRPVNARNYFQQRALTGAIASYHPQHLSAGNFERQIGDGVEIMIIHFVTEELGKELAQGIGTLLNNPEALGNILKSHCYLICRLSRVRHKKQTHPDTCEILHSRSSMR